MELHIGARQRRDRRAQHAALIDADRHRSRAGEQILRRPSRSVRHQELSVSLVVMGFVQRKITRDCR